MPNPIATKNKRGGFVLLLELALPLAPVVVSVTEVGVGDGILEWLEKTSSYAWTNSKRQPISIN